MLLTLPLSLTSCQTPGWMPKIKMPNIPTYEVRRTDGDHKQLHFDNLRQFEDWAQENVRILGYVQDADGYVTPVKDEKDKL